MAIIFFIYCSYSLFSAALEVGISYADNTVGAYPETERENRRQWDNPHYMGGFRLL